MILTLDVGNSQVHGGVFREGKILFQFRKNTQNGSSSDETGLLLRSVLRENGIETLLEGVISNGIVEFSTGLHQPDDRLLCSSPAQRGIDLRCGLIGSAEGRQWIEHCADTCAGKFFNGE